MKKRLIIIVGGIIAAAYWALNQVRSIELLDLFAAATMIGIALVTLRIYTYAKKAEAT